ncbi:MAG TPA: arginine--tRNA ligase [Verrucomicrobiae bacterium]|jgi:arginyl-tRNA synthetase|nr:arginine--tRNA ligase [Verrucomicrobiae bacterium]
MATVLHKILEQKLREAVSTVLDDAGTAALLVRPCPDPRFGDYQTNALMALAKARKMNPRQLATQVAAKLDLAQWCEPVEVAGAGFLNFRLKPSAFAQALREAVDGGPLFFQKTSEPRSIIIDFSSPNAAKPMHVGHIRSTILGDALARILRLLGHHVITDNHIGDWGTQFGKLLVGWKLHLDPEGLRIDPIAEMERLYKLVNAQCESDPSVLESARQELVKLQAGDEENLRLWREMITLSQTQFDRVYARLGVKFDHSYGESYYNPMLKRVVDELTERGLAQPSKGAMMVTFEDLPELKDHPAMVRKSDGGFNYTTTDLATLLFRWQGGTWSVRPNEIIYVTGAPQQLHFKQIFAVFQRWHPEANVKLAHVWFGSVLGEDGKPFKTRSGETVRLEDLLDEAQERALKVVAEKNRDLDEAQKREIARVVGLGAIKYADLAQNRQSDYIFSWDKMLSLQGNTVPYILYAYTRLRSIFRKGGASAKRSAGEFVLTGPEELAMARHLLNFGLALEAAAEDYRPNFLCEYLYELSGHFARFYENCPVLEAEEPTRTTRLGLCDVTARVLKQGLDVLGIETTEQM